MDNPFKFLKDDEWRVLTAFAENRKYAEDDVILVEGEQPKGVFVIRDGKVNVCRKPAGFRIIIAEAGPGSIFGEMSFIESEPADVSVEAASPVDAVFISHDNLKKAIEKSPGIYGRFFQSLAWILSRRLRRTTGRISNEIAESDWRD